MAGKRGTKGTAYGQREERHARAERIVGGVTMVGGSVIKGMAIGSLVSGDPFSGIGGYMIGDAIQSSGKDVLDTGRRRSARASAVEGLIAKSRGGSVALGNKGIVPKKTNADRMRDGAMHLGGPKPPKSISAPPSTNDTHMGTVSHAAPAVPGKPDKWGKAGTMAGERIMGKARGERMASKYYRGMANASAAGGVASRNPYIALGGFVGYIGGQLAATSHARRAEDLRLKASGVNALVHKARTGNTLGVNMQGYTPRPAPPPPPETHKAVVGSAGGVSFGMSWGGFKKANRGFSAAGGKGAPAPAGGKPRKGWSDQARIGAAKARGYENLPYGGSPRDDDGTGQ